MRYFKNNRKFLCKWWISFGRKYTRAKRGTVHSHPPPFFCCKNMILPKFLLWRNPFRWMVGGAGKLQYFQKHLILHQHLILKLVDFWQQRSRNSIPMRKIASGNACLNNLWLNLKLLHCKPPESRFESFFLAHYALAFLATVVLTSVITHHHHFPHVEGGPWKICVWYFPFSYS